MSQPIDSTIHKIVDTCFSDIKDTSPYFCIIQILENATPETSKFSLKRLALKSLFNDALQDEQIVKGVKKVFNELPLIKNPQNSIQIHNIHYFDSNLDLLQTVLANHCAGFGTVSGLDVHTSTCNLTMQTVMEKHILKKISMKCNFQWLHSFINASIGNNVKLFRISVTGMQPTREVIKPKFYQILKQLPSTSGPGCTVKCYTQDVCHLLNSSTVYFKKSCAH